MGYGDAYDEGFKQALADGDADPTEMYEREAIADIQAAADDLRPVYDRLGGKDGFVSLEVSPYLANDTRATIDEARRLWSAVGRPNLMIKVPGTDAGVPAVRQLLEDGLNINVTLLFAFDAYKKVAMAHVEAIEARLAKGEPIDKVASVASFFVSRIDTQIDKQIDERVAKDDPESEALKALRGKVAIANAKLAYAWWQDLVETERWTALAAKGAMPQRLLWASTGGQGQGLPGNALCRYADRPRDGQHDAGQYDGRIPRERHRNPVARRGCRRREVRARRGQAPRAGSRCGYC